MAKRRLIGTITSVKMHETAIVTVTRTKQHPLYGKRYREDSAYAVHNPDNRYQLADIVEIEEHRPISKTKHWVIVRQVGSAAAELDQTALEAGVAAVVAPASETQAEPAEVTANEEA